MREQGETQRLTVLPLCLGSLETKTPFRPPGGPGPVAGEEGGAQQQINNNQAQCDGNYRVKCLRLDLSYRCLMPSRLQSSPLHTEHPLCSLSTNMCVCLRDCVCVCVCIHVPVVGPCSVSSSTRLLMHFISQSWTSVLHRAGTKTEY